MKRRGLALILMAVLSMGALCPVALAEEGGLFPTIRVYEGQFTDVSETDWYYENVQSLYELGLTNGQGSPSLFAPEGDMTVAEALTMAARLRSLYEYGDSEVGPAQYSGDFWYQPYVCYLQALGVIGSEFSDLYTEQASRAQMAHILVHVLPHSLFDPINEEVVSACYDSRAYIKDVSGDTPYWQDILTLYQWGILSGMDRTGSFHPYENIPRCQVAAMVTRLVYRELRIELTWDATEAYSRAGTAMADLIYSDGTFYAAPAPDNLQEIDADVRYMLSRGERSITLHYPPNSLDKATVSNIMSSFLNVIRHFVEQTYNEVECSYSVQSGMVILTFSSSLYEDDLIEQYRISTMEYAIEVHDKLWTDQVITASMTEYEKARIYFTWICENCQYDFAGVETSASMSHSGYQVFADGLAVCDGYTAAYNLLLKLEGIACTTMSTPSHIWTVAELDGITYHIDPTWGDQEDTIAYRYFAMTEADSLIRFQE